MVGELQTATVAGDQLSGTLLPRETEKLLGAHRLQGTQLVHTGDGQDPCVLSRGIQVGEEAHACQEIPAPHRALSFQQSLAHQLVSKLSAVRP